MWVLKMIWDILAAFALCFWVNVFFLGPEGGQFRIELILLGTVTISFAKLELSGWYSND